MKEKKETNEQTTELAKPETKPVATPTPFGFMRRFATDMEQLFEEFEGLRFPSIFGREFFPFTREFEQVAWVPQLEVLRKNEEFIVRADLPGIKRDEIKVELANDLLTISGERKEEKEEKQEGFYRSERTYGMFYRQIRLPEGAKVDTAKAEFNDGVLQITMAAPAREPQTRRLEIKQGKEMAKAATVK